MRGWFFYLIVIAAVVAVVFHFHGDLGVIHLDSLSRFLPKAPEVAPSAPAPTPEPSVAVPLVVSGTCYLITSVKVPNQYGIVTFQRGAALRYIGPQGPKLIVERDESRFTLDPEMVTTDQGIALGQKPITALRLASAGSEPESADSLPFANDPTASLPASSSLPATPYSSDFSTYYPDLVVVDGSEGRGSGCIVQYKGGACLITNAHVISGNSDIHFKRLDSQEVGAGPFSFANGADLAVATQTSSSQGLEVGDVNKDVSIGDDVVVLGNSLGSDVATLIKGKVTGIGPNLVEVDAKFVEGNSGSPIIHVKTGKVIGIATFAQKRRLTTLSGDSQFAGEWRRFGYRLDTVSSWQHPTAQQFYAESQVYEGVHQKTLDLITLAQDLTRGRLELAHYATPGNSLRQIVTDYIEAANSHGKGQLVYGDARMQFIRGVVFTTDSDTRVLRPMDFTWFHWHALQDEFEARDFLKKAFARLESAEQTRDEILR